MILVNGFPRLKDLTLFHGKKKLCLRVYFSYSFLCIEYISSLSVSLTCIEDLSTEFLCGLPYFLLVHCVNSWFLLVYSIVLALMYFSKLLKDLSRTARFSKICLRPLNVACLFIEIYHGVEWSVIIIGDTILKENCREQNCDFENISNYFFYLPYDFTLTAWKIAIRTAQWRLILIAVEVHI